MMHPMAIPITEQWEGSICTGSLIEANEKVYAFYAVRMTDGSAARLTWASSEEGSILKNRISTLRCASHMSPFPRVIPWCFRMRRASIICWSRRLWYQCKVMGVAWRI